MSKVLLFLLCALVANVLAHGVVQTPTPRTVGATATQACGTPVASKLKSDKFGPIEDAYKKKDSTYNATACHLFFCRGYQYEDNKSNTRVYTAGQVVPFTVDIEAHHTGYANVSVVNLKTQKTIGTPLLRWPVYANSSLGPDEWPKNESSFSVTVPDMKGQCSTGGLCAIQWFWYATENSQTYESCIDFTQ